MPSPVDPSCIELVIQIFVSNSRFLQIFLIVTKMPNENSKNAYLLTNLTSALYSHSCFCVLCARVETGFYSLPI